VVAHSRSGYIGGGIGVLAVTALAVRRVGIRVSLIGLAIVISGATTLYYFTTGNETLHRTGSDRAHKSALMRDVDLVVARPFGYGLGTTDRAVYRTPAPGQIGYTESAYLAAALEGGIPALVLYLAVLFMTAMRVRAARLRAIRAGDQSGIVLTAGALAAMLAVAVAGLFLGIHELLIDMLLWGAPGLALAWPVLDHGQRLNTSE
jgi:O-antigen ligase